jgi:L-amino acid N-acyltransferase YncA
MSGPLIIADAGAAHSPTVHAIYAHWVLHGHASFEEVPPDRAEMERRRLAVQELSLPYLVAIEGDKVLGFAYAGLYRPRSAYRFTVEDSVYVAHDAHGKGIGRRLLAELIRRAEAQGKRQMLAVIGDSANAPSIGLHEALGFRRAGVFQSVGFKFGRWLDTVLMQRDLNAGDRSLPG